MNNILPQKMKKRIWCIVIILLGVCLPIIVANLFRISILKHEEYQTLAIEQQTRDAVISPARGTIFDRNMNVLAVSATAETVVINPNSIKTEELREKVSQGLSDILGINYDTIYKKTKAKSYYSVIKRQISDGDAEQVRELIKELKTRAIYLIEDTKRYYPCTTLASTIIGFTNVDGVGIEGLEAYYEKVLAGTAGRIVSVKNAKGTDMPYGYETYEPAQDGKGIVLTIDEVIQNYTEKYLAKAIEDCGVKGYGLAIVMDVNTGEILGLSVMPDYDLNNPREITDPQTLAQLATLSGEDYNNALSAALQSLWRNSAISDTYEPGSIFKLITASMALEEGIVTPQSSFYCNGVMNVVGTKIHCWKTAGHGSETFAKGLENSCNPVFMTVASQIGYERFYNYLRAYGFDTTTGIDLYGETKGILHSKDTISNPVSLAVASFGQTFKVTALQMITAISAIVNGGNLMEPHLVKAITDNEGNVIEEIEPTVVRQVISETTSKTMAKLMEGVVSNGTGKNAYIQGYRVGGKTATSEKIDDKNESGVADKRVVSFVGIAPADDPQIAVLVVLDEPSIGYVSGGAMAGPAVRNILTEVLPYIGVTPVYTAEEMANLSKKVDNYVNKSVSDAETLAKKNGYKLQIIGTGASVVSQVPKSGEKLASGGTVIVYTDTTSQIKVTSVPDVYGLTVEAATAKLQAAGLNISIVGNYFDGDDSVATIQSIDAGEVTEEGTIITVTFTNTNVLDDYVDIEDITG